MNRKAAKKRNEKAKDIAKKVVDTLFSEAQKAKKQEYSDRYSNLARKVAMKHKITLSSEQKRQICKHCKKYLRPGVNARVRLREGKLVYYCTTCKKFSRIPYHK